MVFEKKIIAWIIGGLVILGGAAFLAFYFLSPILTSSNKKLTATVVVSVPLRLSTGKNIANAVTLAFEERKYLAGGIPMRLVILDDGDESGLWQTSKEEENALFAARDESVVAYIGTFNSGAAKISMPILNKAGIVQVSPGNTWPGLTKTGFTPGEPGIFYPTGVRHFVRVCTTDDLQGPAGALWAKELGFKSVYIVDDGEVYGAGIASLFKSEAEWLGISVVGRTTISQEKKDFTDILDVLKKRNPALLYYGGITPNGGPELLKAVRAAGLKTAFMGPDGILEIDFIIAAGEASEGIYATTVGVPPSELKTDEAKLFIESYKKRFQEEPEVFGAFGYEAAQVVIGAITKIGAVNRNLILREIRGTREFKGLFGIWGFDQNGDTTLTLMSGNQVKNGEFTFLKNLDVVRH